MSIEVPYALLAVPVRIIVFEAGVKPKATFANEGPLVKMRPTFVVSLTFAPICTMGSVMTSVVVFTVVTVPFTCKFPEIVRFGTVNVFPEIENPLPAVAITPFDAYTIPFADVLAN